MTQDELIYLIEKTGHKIKITIKEEQKYVTFIGTYALEPYTLSNSWSLEFTDAEIKRETVYKLMSWAGLKIEERVTYI